MDKASLATHNSNTTTPRCVVSSPLTLPTKARRTTKPGSLVATCAGMADRDAKKASLTSGSRKRARSEQDPEQTEVVPQLEMQRSAIDTTTATATRAATAAAAGAATLQRAPTATAEQQAIAETSATTGTRRSSRTRATSKKQQRAEAEAAACSSEDKESGEQQQPRSSRRSRRSTVNAAAAVGPSGAAVASSDAQEEIEAPGHCSRGKAGNAAAKASSRKNASNGKSSSSSGPTRAAEQRLWQQGYKLVAGVDEAGRGPLAGPVVAAAAILPPDVEFPGLNDSKQVTEEDRDRLYDLLTTHPDVIYAVSVVDHETIDEINILQAAMLAMQQAVEGLNSKPDHLLIDGNRRPKGLQEDLPAQLLVKGDATSTCIAAASVIAKVTRDRLMMELDRQYPLYGFAQHKGYGVPAHRAAIQQHGPCPVHRRSFEPVKSMVGFAGYGQKARAAAAAAAERAQTPSETATEVNLGEELDITALVAAAAAAAAGVSDQMRSDATEAAAATAAVAPGVLNEVQASSADMRACKTAGASSKKGRRQKKTAVGVMVQA